MNSSFSIQLLEMNLNVCEEYKTERKARRSNNGKSSSANKGNIMALSWQ